MNIKYEYYFDESEHSRKINEKTVNGLNYHDNYIGSFLEVDTEQVSNFAQLYEEFEEKYKDRKRKNKLKSVLEKRDVLELKSDTISTKQIKFGFSSCNDNNIEFISDLLEIVDTNKIFISLSSKLEYVVRQLLSSYDIEEGIIEEALIYSVVKSLLQYKPKKVLEAIETKSDSILEVIIEFYIERIKRNQKNRKLKNSEIAAFEQILYVLNKINSSVNIDWDYSLTFVDFYKYLKFNNINDYWLYLDSEGVGKTLKGAQKVGLLNSSERDSLSSEGIRCADMFAGLIGKMIKAIEKDLNKFSYDEKLERKVISSEFFKLRKNEFNLYLQLNKLLVDGTIEIQDNCYYRDYYLMLIHLIEYITSFKNYSDFDALSYKQHTKNFDERMLLILHEQFQQMNIQAPSLPVVEILEKNDESFIGQYGETIYKDTSKHDVLPVEKDGSIYHVINVGINHESNIATMTVKEEGAKYTVYKLPEGAKSWVYGNIGFSSYGMNLFPSDVMVNEINDSIYFEFIVV